MTYELAVITFIVLVSMFIILLKAFNTINRLEKQIYISNLEIDRLRLIIIEMEEKFNE